MSTEDEADEQERAEAEALARALEGHPPSAGASRELETAALLHAVAPAELSDERARAIHARLQPEIARHVQPPRARRGVVLWLATGLAAAAAVALYFAVSETEGAHAPRADVESSALPAPPARLLAAQAALGDKPEAAQREMFEREMRAYRLKVLKQLKAAYPTQVGMLEPERGR